MKILQVIDGLGFGGAEKLVVDTVPELVERGYTVDVLLLDSTVTPFYEELQSKQCTSIFALGRGFYNPLYLFKIIPYLRKYDVVHVHLFPAQYFVAAAKWISRAPTKLIFTEHNTVNKRLMNPKFRGLERMIYSQYDRVLCITESVRSVLMDKLDLPEKKLKVVENGIDFDLFSSAEGLDRRLFGFSDNDRLLIQVAGFREQKDQDTVIRAMALLPANYHLLLVGDGLRRTELTALAKASEVDSRVHFLGVRQDVPQLMKMCDYAVMSSHWEGFGLSAVEAMASGLPVVVSNVEGLAQVVGDGGVLFEKGNVQQLVDKILLMSDKEIACGLIEKAVKRAKAYDRSAMMDKLINQYQTILR
ncbi:glycosyltransferase [Riemerella anatipestifer]|nr:glycosyltransferase [Riemerella anatipestifer]